MKTKKPKTVYISGSLRKTLEFSTPVNRLILAPTTKLDFNDKKTGVIGVMLVFSNKAKARKFSPKSELIEGTMPG